MSFRVLVVKSEIYLASELEDLLSDYSKAFDFTFVENRKEAVTILKQESFDRVVTALQIPRISDGYLFLSQLVDKHLKSENIIVVVDEKTDNVITSINSRGVVHIYSATSLESVVKVLVKAVGTTSSVNKKMQGSIAAVNYDLEKVKTELNYVMGPVGNMIFTDVVNRWQDHNNLSELLNLIQIEINDKEKIELFRDRLS